MPPAMPPHLHIDFETFSKADIKAVGAYRYAFDPSTEILCAAMALDDGEPEMAYCDEVFGWVVPIEAGFALGDPEVLIYAHNAQFEFAIMQALLEKTWGIPCPDVSRFRCTMSLARRAALPGGLDKLSEVLELEQAKHKTGTKLKLKFSVMQKPKKPTKKNPEGLPARRIMPQDEPEAFAEFMAYCAQDVRAEQEIARRLAYFDEPINNANYTLHEVINARGVTVNLDALRHAQRLIEEETEIVSAAFRELTSFEVTQGAKLLAWCKEQGFDLPNLQAETVESVVDEWEGKEVKALSYFIHPESESFWTKEGPAEEEDFAEANVEEVSRKHFIAYVREANKAYQLEPDPVAILALRMKQSIAYASIKKVAAMIACAGPHDNRIRGMLNHHGATTGRSTNSLVQFQNMKRPTIKNSEEAYREICGGISLEMLRCCYGPPLEVISSCVRHFVENAEAINCPDCGGVGYWTYCDDPPLHLPCYCGGSGKTSAPLLDADYSAIEARIVNWLAGQEDALEEYRQGIDRYKVMASVIYGVPAVEVNKFPQRFLGKTTILGAGFSMGPTKFRATCKKMGYELPMGLEEVAIKAFRVRHPKVKQYWYDVERCAKTAILRKGEVVKHRNVAFICKDIEGLPFLLIRLPSGRKLAYPRPRIEADRILFFGHILGAQWGDVSTWGGKLVENITQAVAGDILCHGVANAEAASYETATLIHDQALSYYRDGQSSDEFVELLTDLPAWADGLPIAAEGSLVPFYKKD